MAASPDQNLEEHMPQGRTAWKHMGREESTQGKTVLPFRRQVTEAEGHFRLIGKTEGDGSYFCFRH